VRATDGLKRAAGLGDTLALKRARPRQSALEFWTAFMNALGGHK
jgi:hypothetical protein